MRQATQPIAIVSSGKQRTAVDARGGNFSGDSSDDDDDYEKQEYFHPPLRDRPLDPSFPNRNPMFQSDVESNLNIDDPLIVGSLPISRRERRFLVSTGGQEVGGYGLAHVGPNTRLVLAPKTWNNSARQRLNSSPPPAPLLESRKDGERGEKISRMPKMALPESLATSLDSSSIKMSYGSLRENSFQRYYHQTNLTQASSVFEPKSLPYSTKNGLSSDIFSRLHSNNSIHKLNGDTGNGEEDIITSPVSNLKPTNKVGSVSALASLLGDYNIGEAGSSSPINRGDHGNDKADILGNDGSSTRGSNLSALGIHNTGTFSYLSNHSDMWDLHSNEDNTSVQSPNLNGQDEFLLTSSSLTGLNILESSHNTAATYEINPNPLNTLNSEFLSTFHTTSSQLCPLGGTEFTDSASPYLNQYHDQIHSGQQEAFDLEMDT